MQWHNGNAASDPTTFVVVTHRAEHIQVHRRHKSQVDLCIHIVHFAIVPNLNHSQGIFVVGATDKPKSPGHIIKAAHFNIDHHFNYYYYY